MRDWMGLGCVAVVVVVVVVVPSRAPETCGLSTKPLLECIATLAVQDGCG